MIRVLVVDDSATFRGYLVRVLESDPEIAVVGCASTGHQALEMVARLRPTIVTMDALMPDLDGVEATELILQSHRVPIIIVSAVASGRHGIRALGAGAVEAVAKPTGGADRGRFQAQLLQSVKLLSEVPILLRRPMPLPQSPAAGASLNRSNVIKVVAIGASTGGPAIIGALLQSLASEFRPTIVIAQHISEGFDHFLVDWWSQATTLTVELASSGKFLAPGTVLVAPATQHLMVRRDGTVECNDRTETDFFVPSIDRLFKSIAGAYGPSALGLLLSGMGNDGAAGLLAMRAAGAGTAVQAPSSAVVGSMPSHALEIGAASTALQPEEMAAWVGGITTL